MAKRYGTQGPRILSPDCCTSMKLAQCSMEAQLLFDRVLVTCDDQGRREGALPLVRAACFPMLDVALKRLAGWLTELHEAGLVYAYDAEGTPALQVTNWWEYQHTMRRAYPSKIGPPEGWTDLIGEISLKDVENAGNATRVDCPETRQNAADCRKVPASAVACAVASAVAGAVASASAEGVGPPAPHHVREKPKRTAKQRKPDPRAVALADSHLAAARRWKPDVADNFHTAASLEAYRLLLSGGSSHPPRDFDEAVAIVQWLQGGLYAPVSDFDWRPNVLSGSALRKHWDRLTALRANGRSGGQSQTADAFAQIEREIRNGR